MLMRFWVALSMAFFHDVWKHRQRIQLNTNLLGEHEALLSLQIGVEKCIVNTLWSTLQTKLSTANSML